MAKHASGRADPGRTIRERHLRQLASVLGATASAAEKVALDQLPKAVAKRFPKAARTIDEAVVTVKDGKDAPGHYEAVPPDGKFKAEIDKTRKKN